MTRLPDARQLLTEAERAASAGDLGSADDLLRQAANIQETELGSLHPDLASTLNNLAIVAERTGRPGDAETFYRRAAAIASASLPADHPMVAASRQNLEDFCRATGLPVETPPLATPPVAMPFETPPTETTDASQQSPGRDAKGAATAPVRAAPARTAPVSAPAGQAAIARPAAAEAPSPEPDHSHGASRMPAWLGIGVAVVLAAALVATRPWSSSDAGGASVTPESEGAAEPSALAAPATESSVAQPAGLEGSVVAGPAETPAAEPPSAAAGAEPQDPPAEPAPSLPARSANGVTLTVAELCRAFSTGGRSWQCDPAGASVAPGRLVFYTRVRSPRDTAIVHRWYRGDTLRQAVTLRIRANPTEGYRTYSRQTVDAGEDWRVEVTTEAGDQLHEHGFAVR